MPTNSTEGPARRITKAVIPAAGLGTRLRPLTADMPKELLPVGGKPMIQYALEMYMASGISDFCIIISPQKHLVRDFITGNWSPPAFPFPWDAALYQKLEACRTVFLTQDKPRGVADAIGLARDFVGDESFACVMPDCLLFSDKPMAKQLMKPFRRCKTHVIGTILVKAHNARRFGNVGLLAAATPRDGCFAVTSLSEKTPKPLSVHLGSTIHKGFGGGIYLPEYFDLVEAIRPHAKGEIDDVPIHQILIKERKLFGVLLEGVAFDAGQPLGFRAAVQYAGRREESLEDLSGSPGKVGHIG